MTVYFVLLSVVCSLVALAQRIRHRQTSVAVYAAACAALVAVAGMRSRYVGTDAGYYALWFDNVQTLGDALAVKLEPGYFVLCWLAHHISDDYSSIFTMVAVIIILCFCVIVARHSVNPAYSMFFFIAGGDYFISYNGMRQGLAIAVYALGIESLIRRNWRLYVTCVVAASLFHKTAIIALPAYFLIARRNSLKELLAVLASGVVCVLSFELLFPLATLLDQRYSQYGESADEGLGLGVTGLMVIFSVFFVLFKGRVTRYREAYDTFLNMYLLSTLIAVVAAALGMSASGVRRISLYFSFSAIFLWPIVIASIRNWLLRASLVVSLGALYLAYLGLSLQRFGNLVPYLLNPRFL